MDKTTQERIKAEAEAKYPLVASHTITDGPRAGYIAGATAENERAQFAINVLNQIANSPVPLGGMEMLSWTDMIKNLCHDALQQWKDGKKEVEHG